MKVKRQWCHLCRAADKLGNSVDLF
ncbi:hypothetical protein EPI11_14270 [Flavobacterium cerinum]|uniref:Uncharacterized protein n=1 Tax=Flavobacterium cerinum TaxID=2502784 RepID=A0A444H112_9FLAO|nr:hypothetical protein EPI11_14270 [Flavobacterium cerinum]